MIKPRGKIGFHILLKSRFWAIFCLGFLVTIISQISFKFISQSQNLDLIVISTPLILVSIYYLFLIMKTKSQFKVL